MINIFMLDFKPLTAAWVHQSSDILHTLAITDADSPTIRIFDGKGTNEPIHRIEDLHSKPVALIDVSFLQKDN
jgi:peptidylprolyl isomerase domain and WD repeat-containing protein 1